MEDGGESASCVNQIGETIDHLRPKYKFVKRNLTPSHTYLCILYIKRSKLRNQGPNIKNNGRRNSAKTFLPFCYIWFAVFKPSVPTHSIICILHSHDYRNNGLSFMITLKPPLMHSYICIKGHQTYRIYERGWLFITSNILPSNFVFIGRNPDFYWYVLWHERLSCTKIVHSTGVIQIGLVTHIYIGELGICFVFYHLNQCYQPWGHHYFVTISDISERVKIVVIRHSISQSQIRHLNPEILEQADVNWINLHLYMRSLFAKRVPSQYKGVVVPV